MRCRLENSGIWDKNLEKFKYLTEIWNYFLMIERDMEVMEYETET